MTSDDDSQYPGHFSLPRSLMERLILFSSVGVARFRPQHAVLQDAPPLSFIKQLPEDNCRRNHSHADILQLLTSIQFDISARKYQNRHLVQLNNESDLQPANDHYTSCMSCLVESPDKYRACFRVCEQYGMPGTNNFFAPTLFAMHSGPIII